MLVVLVVDVVVLVGVVVVVVGVVVEEVLVVVEVGVVVVLVVVDATVPGSAVLVEGSSLGFVGVGGGVTDEQLFSQQRQHAAICSRICTKHAIANAASASRAHGLIAHTTLRRICS